MENEIIQPETPRSRQYRRPAGRFVFVVLFVIANAVIGLVGGVAGFTLMSNSKSPAIQNLRNRLGLSGSNSSVSIPVTQNVKVEESSAVIDAAKKVSPAVVAISGNQQVQDFFGNTSNQQVSGGSGFILTSDGLILTNKHVVSDTTEKYKVVLNDGRIFDATVQSLDTINDLALVKIDAKDLPTVELGSSDSLQVGQYVLAVGNALAQFDNSVTLGIVSAKNRSISAGDASSAATEDLTGLIQTDAAINPGNSGGPLVNMAGQVVGINTAIASAGSGSGSIGIGFAIPTDSFKTVINNAIKSGKIVHPYLGLRYVAVTTTVKEYNNLPVDYGAYIEPSSTQAPVIAGGPADKAGVKSGDIILEINGQRIDSSKTLPTVLQAYQPGDTVTLHIQRGTGTVDVKVTLGTSQ